MRIAVALLTLAVSTSVLSAQEATEQEIGALENCVADSANTGSKWFVRQSCLGQMTRNCKQEKQDDTTLGISECIMHELGAWDALLNRWWKEIRKQSKAKGTWDEVLAAQRQWIDDRDADCDNAYAAADGGSIRVIWGASCRNDLTAHRAVDFYFDLHRR